MDADDKIIMSEKQRKEFIKAVSTQIIKDLEEEGRIPAKVDTLTVPNRVVMDLKFAVFNCHINNAEHKTKKAFIKRFGIDLFNKEIQPQIDEGIMGIFSKDPNKYLLWYVETIGVYVNELAEAK